MSPSLRLAFLADIHGNLPALEAVLRDLERQAPDRIYLLGDLVNRCPWNSQVMDLLMERGWPAIAGNHDLVVGRLHTPDIFPPFHQRERFPIIYWTWERLDPRHVAALRALPASLAVNLGRGAPIRLVHGVPGDPFTGFYPTMPQDKLHAWLHAIQEPVVLCGHTHRPLDWSLKGKRILNPGSVGLPYNRDPRAQYMLLDLIPVGGTLAWRPTFRRVDYDRSAAERAFQSSGMLDEAGPLAALYLRTLLTGEPWASDFGYWLKSQPKTMRQDLSAAVQRYVHEHGPGNWAFPD